MMMTTEMTMTEKTMIEFAAFVGIDYIVTVQIDNNRTAKASIFDRDKTIFKDPQIVPVYASVAV